jgi:hypothetical protein
MEEVILDSVDLIYVADWAKHIVVMSRHLSLKKLETTYCTGSRGGTHGGEVRFRTIRILWPGVDPWYGSSFSFVWEIRRRRWVHGGRGLGSGEMVDLLGTRSSPADVLIYFNSSTPYPGHLM